MSGYSLAIHGGAGTILKSKMTPEREAAYRAGLSTALEAGEAVLDVDGRRAVDDLGVLLLGELPEKPQ